MHAAQVGFWVTLVSDTQVWWPALKLEVRHPYNTLFLQLCMLAAKGIIVSLQLGSYVQLSNRYC